MRVLVLALSGIGDALMFTPALRLIRKARPDATIDVLVMYGGARDIYRRNPDVTQTIHFDFLREGPLASLRFVLGLRGSYDATMSVYPANRREYNLIARLIGAPRRLAVRYRRGHGANWGFLNTDLVEEIDTVHNVEENARLVRLLLGQDVGQPGPLAFPLQADDIARATKSLAGWGIGASDVVIGMHPGCSTLKNHEKRRWDPEKFGALARLLAERHQAKVLVFGGPDEEALKQKVCEISGSAGVLNVRTDDLAHTAAVMKRCSCFVTNDSSLMHVASAMQLNVVAILGPTSPYYVRPWQTPHQLVSLGLECSPCFVYSPKPLTCTRTDVAFKCVKEITVERVYEAARSFVP